MTPPIIACVPRTPGYLKAIIAAEDVEHTADLQPNYGRDYVTGKIVSRPGWTHCNLLVERVMKALGVPLPSGMLAHEQLDWLGSQLGFNAGWKSCLMADAIKYANLGQPVVVGYRNPLVPPAGHSHIAVGIPTVLGPIHVAQAGRANFSDKAVGFGFGSLPVRFFYNS